MSATWQATVFAHCGWLLMRAITEHTGVPASNQRLVIGSRELDLAGRVDGDRGTEVTLVQGTLPFTVYRLPFTFTTVSYFTFTVYFYSYVHFYCTLSTRSSGLGGLCTSGRRIRRRVFWRAKNLGREHSFDAKKVPVCQESDKGVVADGLRVPYERGCKQDSRQRMVQAQHNNTWWYPLP